MSEKNGNGAPKTETKALWQAFMAGYKAKTAAELAQTKAEGEMSLALGAIAEALGTGPFNVTGLGLVTIVTRQKKDDDGKLIGDPRHYIKRMGDVEITEVKL